MEQLALRKPGHSFYVTVVDDGRHGFLLGPYDTHSEAKDNVNRGRSLAEKSDVRAAFYGFGTAQAVDGKRTVFGS